MWEHTTGIRVHTSGLMRLSNGEFASANRWPESQESARYIKISGGNRRRGLMCWALAVQRNEGPLSGDVK